MYVFKASLLFLVAVVPSVFGKLGGDVFKSVQGDTQQAPIEDRTLLDTSTANQWDCEDVGGIYGLTTDEGYVVCCDEGCGQCGGGGCGADPLGAHACCTSTILNNHVACIHDMQAPCVLASLSMKDDDE